MRLRRRLRLRRLRRKLLLDHYPYPHSHLLLRLLRAKVYIPDVKNSRRSPVKGLFFLPSRTRMLSFVELLCFF